MIIYSQLGPLWGTMDKERTKEGDKIENKMKRMKMLAYKNRMLLHVCLNCKTTIEIPWEREKSHFQLLILMLDNSIGFNQVTLHYTFLNKTWPSVTIQINKKYVWKTSVSRHLLYIRSKTRAEIETLVKNLEIFLIPNWALTFKTEFKLGFSAKHNPKLRT